MIELKTHKNVRKFCLLMAELEAKSYLTKLGGANNFDRNYIC